MVLGCMEHIKRIGCTLGWSIIVFGHPGQYRHEAMGSMGFPLAVWKERLTIILRVFGHGQALVNQLWCGMSELLGSTIGIGNSWFVSSRKWGRIRRFWESTWGKGIHHGVRVLPGKTMSVGTSCGHLRVGCCVDDMGISQAVGRPVVSLA